jgi:hypothetical protein
MITRVRQRVFDRLFDASACRRRTQMTMMTTMKKTKEDDDKEEQEPRSHKRTG